jgi:hypothetical protein
MSIERYTDLGIGKIINSNLIDEKDIKILSDNVDTLAHIYLHKQIYRTETEMRFSVLNEVKFPSKSSKYWQCVRECDNMFKSLIDESINYEELTAQIELKEIELKEINPNSKRTNALTKLKNCEIKRLHFKLMDLKLTSKDRVREVKLWLQIMSDCIKDDPTINISNVDEHQLESYKQRFEKEVKIALESNNNSLFKSASMHLEGLK